MDITKEQVSEDNPNLMNQIMFERRFRVIPAPVFFTFKPLDRHEDIIKDILEWDPWDKRWTVVARRALMHDNYDVCLVANLNPRGLMSPPADLVKL